MVNNRMVYHDGEVVSIEGDSLRVKIVSQSACSDCHAKGVCTAAETEEKFIDAVSSVPGTSFKVGDAVTLIMEERLGWLAIFYGFLFPLIVVVAVLLMVSAGGGSEAEAALLGIGSLLPYYLLLYFFRQKIEKEFIFRAEKKN